MTLTNPARLHALVEDGHLSPEEAEDIERFGMLTPEEVERVNADLDLIVFLVKTGAISEQLARDVIDDMAEDMAQQKIEQWVALARANH